MFHEAISWCKIWKNTNLWFGEWHEEFVKFSPEHTKLSKFGLSLDSFIQSRKCMSLKLRGELCIVTMKNDAKFEDELTCQFKIDMGIWPMLTRVLKNLNNVLFNRILLNKVYNVWAKKSIVELCLMAMNSDATFDGKVTCFLKTDMRNWANFP